AVRAQPDADSQDQRHLPRGWRSRATEVAQHRRGRRPGTDSRQLAAAYPGAAASELASQEMGTIAGPGERLLARGPAALDGTSDALAQSARAGSIPAGLVL